MVSHPGIESETRKGWYRCLANVLMSGIIHMATLLDINTCLL